MIDTKSKILLITAHPDDESMFFSPFLTYLTQHGLSSNLYILCLSTGFQTNTHKSFSLLFFFVFFYFFACVNPCNKFKKKNENATKGTQTVKAK